MKKGKRGRRSPSVPVPLRTGDETLTILRFQEANRRVAYYLRWYGFMLVGNSSKRSDHPENSIRVSSESNSQSKSLILAQNERWRQA